MLKLIKIGRVNMKITKKELKKTIKKELKKELKKAKKKEKAKTIEQVVTPVQITKEKPKSILVLTIGLTAQLIVILELVLKILNVLKELL